MIFCRPPPLFLLMIAVLALSFLPSNLGDAIEISDNVFGHHENPDEVDVTSKSCDYDSRKGFAGDIGNNFFTVEYFYILRVNSSLLSNTEIAYNEAVNYEELPYDSLHNVVFQVELEIGSHLLKESGEFRNAPCNNARRLVMRQTQEAKNVGLTIGPDDEIVANCESDDTNTLCYWVAGSFQVYTVGTSGNTTASSDKIKMDIKDAMDSGEFDKAHTAILNLTYMEALPSNTADGATTDGTDGSGSSNSDTISAETKNGPDAAIIVSASVGAVLLLAAIALASRRRNRHDDQSEFQPSNMDVSEFHVSREESVAEDPLA
jgi:hypothetical protein